MGPIPKRALSLAVAQMGPVHLADTRTAVVARLVAMLREAHARHADFVVFPELALTTFFPRYWMSEEDAGEHMLQIAGTQDRPAPGTHVGRLTSCPDCRVRFDLVPDQRVNGAPLAQAEETR